MSEINGKTPSRMKPRRGWLKPMVGLAGVLLGSPAALAAEEGKQFQDWKVKCEKIEESAKEQCFIFQTLIDDDAKQPVLQTVVGYLQDGKPAIIFTVPLGVALRAGVGVKIDDSEPMRIPYEHCTPSGCIAGLPLDDKTLGSFKRGLESKVLVYDASGRPISLALSLKGFTAGFSSLKAATP